MKRNLSIVLSLTAVLTFTILSCDTKEPTAPERHTADIYGQVINARDGSAVAAAQVSAYYARTLRKQVSTNATGEYRLDDLQIDEPDLSQAFTIKVSKTGFLLDSTDVELAADQTLQMDLNLTPILPELSVSRDTLAFGEDEDTLKFTLTNGSAYGSFQWRASPSVGWLLLSPNTGTINATTPSQEISCSVTRAGQDESTYPGLISITTHDENAGSHSIQVSMIVPPPPENPQLVVSPTEADFGLNLNLVTLTITNGASQGSFNWRVASVEYLEPGVINWLSVSPDTGLINQVTTAQQIYCTVRRDSLPLGVGTFHSVMTLTSWNQDAGSKQVELTISSPDTTQPHLSVFPEFLDFQGNSDTVRATVSNIGVGQLNWSTAENISWLVSVRPASGALATGESSTLILIADRSRSGLAEGQSDTGNVSFTSNDGSAIISVAITVPVTIPRGPRNLQFTRVTNRSIEMRWDDRSSNEDLFLIKRRAGDFGGFASHDDVAEDMTTYLDTINVLPGTTYYYQIFASNSAGLSDSAAGFTTTLPDTPFAPSGLTASAVSSSEINLRWFDNSDNEDGFVIELKTGVSGDWANRNQVARNVSSYQDRGLLPETEYFYRVYAYNNGGRSGYSNEASDTTASRPIVPRLSLDQLNIDFSERDTVKQLTVRNDGEGTLDWEASEGAAWLSISPVSGEAGAGESDVIRLTATRAGLSEGDSLSTRLRVTSNGGNDSAEVQLTKPYTQPNAPSNLTADAVSTTQVDLAWQDNSDNEQGFKIERKTGDAGDWSHITEVVGNTESFEDDGLDPNTTYFYRVKAFNPAGNAVSDSAEATTLPVAGSEREFPLGDTGLNIVMCWIPSGEFEMGSPDNEQDRAGNEGPAHQVTFNYGFWMGKYEVTQQQWEAVMGQNPALDYGVGDDYPVYYVSWDDIQNFEEAIDNELRLPSEAEWEYACRARTTTRFYWGDDPDYSQIREYAWYEDNSEGSTHPVGDDKIANDCGLHNMSGNVGEWCEDWYHDSYNGAPSDGSAWVAGGGDQGVMRGGAFGFYAKNCRSAYRDRGNHTGGYASVGFRLVRDP